MTTKPAAIIQRASNCRLSRKPTTTIAAIEETPDGDIASPETRAS